MQTDITGGATVADVALMSDGRIVAVGHADPSMRDTVVVARYLADGSLDPSFSDDGLAFQNVARGSADQEFPEAVAVSQDGSVIVVGSVSDPFANGPSTIGFAARFTSSGSFDTTFGSAGAQYFDGHAITDVALDGGRADRARRWGGPAAHPVWAARHRLR